MNDSRALAGSGAAPRPAPESGFAPWAVIPAKRFARAKSRLRAALEPGDRRELATRLFDCVLDACLGCSALRGVLVATDGDDVAARATRRAAHVLRDPEAPAPLATIIDRALAAVRLRGATHAVVIMGDLPLLMPRDVAELVSPLRSTDAVIVPDRTRRGTGALGLRLDLNLSTQFGHGDSLERHLRAAREHGIRCTVLNNPRIAFDVDAASDLARAPLATQPHGEASQLGPCE